MYDLIIKNGIIVNEGVSSFRDIAVKDGKISRISSLISDDAREKIDAQGKYIIPGIIDAHIHLNLKVMDFVSQDTYRTATKKAAQNGVTTVIDFTDPSQTLVESIRKKKLQAENNSCIDYSFHSTINNDNKKTLDEIKDAVDLGITSFKLYMVYDGLKLNLGQIENIAREINRQNAIPIVHAESDKLLNENRKKLVKDNLLEPQYQPVLRDKEVEIKAVRNIIDIARKNKLRFYFVHISTSGAGELIKKARYDGVKIMGETCPQYLVLDKNIYVKKDCVFYLASPPLRDEKDQSALWKLLSENALQVVSTDHCPFTIREKLTGSKDLLNVPNGLPGIETTLRLIYTYGVKKKNISIERMVYLLSHNPSRIFAMGSVKGFIKEGYDADLVIFNSKTESVIENSMDKSSVFNPYAGFKLFGSADLVLSRGEIVSKNGIFTGDFSHGRFVKRSGGIDI